MATQFTVEERAANALEKIAAELKTIATLQGETNREILRLSTVLETLMLPKYGTPNSK